MADKVAVKQAEVGLPGAAQAPAAEEERQLVPGTGLDNAPVTSILQLRAPEHTVGKTTKSPPSHMASQDGAYADAWNWFQEIDTDGSGFLDKEELTVLIKKCSIKIANRDIKSTFNAMDTASKGEVNFEQFASWWNAQKEAARRRMRRGVKEVFENVDADDSGRLDYEEFAMVAKKAKNILGIHPPFDAVADWEKVAKKNNPETGEEEVTYQAFESWWKERLGIVDADIPVLPEYMVQKIDEAAYYSKKHAEAELRAQGVPTPRPAGGTEDQKRTGPREAKELWDSLRPRLLSVVRMQRQWGPLHDIYDSQQASRFDLTDLPPCIRDPDSSFSAVWDLTQVALLLYVAITVPLRAGFSIEVDLWSFAFFLDAAIDLYFISDICLNFVTAYYKKDGTREERYGPIAINYLKGWFFIDFVSTLPVSYVPYFVDDGGGTGSLNGEGTEGSNFRAMKALRLVRLSKMLRLARIKKILMKYGDNVNLQTYISVGFTMFTIFFLVHLLTCFFYMVGVSEQTMTNGVIIPGWVQGQEGFEYDPDSGALVQGGGSVWGPDANAVDLGDRYVSSTYFVLNALENGGTYYERCFALFAELMRDFILGMVAGLMTTISMAMNGGEQESQWKLKSLKGWMQKNNLPKLLQIRITEYCHELWNNRSGFNIDELFADVPPAMRTHLKQFLYSGTIGQIPLFRGLSREVIGALCGAARPMYALNGQTVMEEGQPGRELYMLMSGELEVFVNSTESNGVDGAPKKERLGFLSEGSFFGEAAVLADESGRELRRRTLCAVTDSELCFLTREDIVTLRAEYPELDARLKRFVNVGSIRLTKKNAIGKLFPEMSSSAIQARSQAEGEQRKMMSQYASHYDDMKATMKTINQEGVSEESGSTQTVTLEQLGVSKVKATQQQQTVEELRRKHAALPGSVSFSTDPQSPRYQPSTLSDLPTNLLPGQRPPSPSGDKLAMMERQLHAFEGKLEREIGQLHSKNDNINDTLAQILRKLNDMEAGK